MCIGERLRHARLDTQGFTLVEVLVGIVLSLMLAVSAGRLVVSMQSTSVREADRAIMVAQSRVATARLERDLRCATAAGSLFAVDSPVLEATPYQFVLLGRQSGGEGLVLIEWEIVGSRLMRRWGVCPEERPSEFLHTLYVDHKTMLEGVAPDTSFEYCLHGDQSVTQVPEVDLSQVSSVRLTGGGVDDDGRWAELVECEGRVGR